MAAAATRKKPKIIFSCGRVVSASITSLKSVDPVPRANIVSLSSECLKRAESSCTAKPAGQLSPPPVLPLTPLKREKQSPPDGDQLELLLRKKERRKFDSPVLLPRKEEDPPKLRSKEHDSPMHHPEKVAKTVQWRRIFHLESTDYPCTPTAKLSPVQLIEPQKPPQTQHDTPHNSPQLQTTQQKQPETISLDSSSEQSSDVSTIEVDEDEPRNEDASSSSEQCDVMDVDVDVEASAREEDTQAQLVLVSTLLHWRLGLNSEMSLVLYGSRKVVFTDTDILLNPLLPVVTTTVNYSNIAAVSVSRQTVEPSRTAPAPFFEFSLHSGEHFWLRLDEDSNLAALRNLLGRLPYGLVLCEKDRAAVEAYFAKYPEPPPHKAGPPQHEVLLFQRCLHLTEQDYCCLEPQEVLHSAIHHTCTGVH
eukprot:TRINITY_DN1705_c0_g1_i11.p1 TRINITY_DN1705_c0_g1~~TRINITY_DN1705_c0_g1_i11.p1  ORF type:complete len:420 (-),score=95.05 TRINITY_DN1705_c0_g1_i11:727-1986(-)